MHELSVKGKIFYPHYEIQLKIVPFDVDQPDKGFGERFRLILFSQGNGTIQVNEHVYPMITPAVCCLNEKDHLTILAQDNLMGKCMYFHPESINKRLSFTILYKPDQDWTSGGSLDNWSLRTFTIRESGYHGYMPLDMSLSKKIIGLMEIIERLIEDQPHDGWPCMSRSYLMEFLLLLSRLYECSNANEIASATVMDDSIRPILLYLTQSYHKKIKLVDLTRQFHTNKTSLNERFKKATGMPVMSYLINIRMQLACSILKNTLLSVSEIMTRLGFSDDAHFLRTFKKYSGLTPTEYRNMNCWMLHK